MSSSRVRALKNLLSGWNQIRDLVLQTHTLLRPKLSSHELHTAGKALIQRAPMGILTVLCIPLGEVKSWCHEFLEH